MRDGTCPRCKSSQITLLSAVYPKEFECAECGHMFVESGQALIDE